MFFKMRSAYFVAALSTVLTVAAVASAKYGARNSKVTFFTKGTVSLMNIEGTVEKLEMQEDDKTVTFKTSIVNVKTGIDGRDNHLKKLIPKHDVKLVLAKDKVDSKAKKGTVTANLLLNGTQRDIPVTYEINGDKHVTATFVVDVTQHGVKKDDLCKLAVCVQPTSSVKVVFDLTE